MILAVLVRPILITAGKPNTSLLLDRSSDLPMWLYLDCLVTHYKSQRYFTKENLVKFSSAKNSKGVFQEFEA